MNASTFHSDQSREQNHRAEQQHQQRQADTLRHQPRTPPFRIESNGANGNRHSAKESVGATFSEKLEFNFRQSGQRVLLTLLLLSATLFVFRYPLLSSLSEVNSGSNSKWLHERSYKYESDDYGAKETLHTFPTAALAYARSIHLLPGRVHISPRLAAQFIQGKGQGAVLSFVKEDVLRENPPTITKLKLNFPSMHGHQQLGRAPSQWLIHLTDGQSPFSQQSAGDSEGNFAEQLDRCLRDEACELKDYIPYNSYTIMCREPTPPSFLLPWLADQRKSRPVVPHLPRHSRLMWQETQELKTAIGSRVLLVAELHPALKVSRSLEPMREAYVKLRKAILTQHSKVGRKVAVQKAEDKKPAAAAKPAKSDHPTPAAAAAKPARPDHPVPAAAAKPAKPNHPAPAAAAKPAKPVHAAPEAPARNVPAEVRRRNPPSHQIRRPPPPPISEEEELGEEFVVPPHHQHPSPPTHSHGHHHPPPKHHGSDEFIEPVYYDDIGNPMPECEDLVDPELGGWIDDEYFDLELPWWHRQFMPMPEEEIGSISPIKIELPEEIQTCAENVVNYMLNELLSSSGPLAGSIGVEITPEEIESLDAVTALETLRAKSVGVSIMAHNAVSQTPCAAQPAATFGTSSASEKMMSFPDLRPMSLLVHLDPAPLQPYDRQVDKRKSALRVLKSIRQTMSSVMPHSRRFVGMRLVSKDSSLARVEIHPLRTDQNLESESLLARTWKVASIIAKHPNVLYVERAARHQSLNQHASYVTQMGIPHEHPLWKRGLKGEGLVSAVADTGVDHDSCFFHDPDVATPINRYDARHRKIIAYLTSMRLAVPDRVGGDQVDGHGTHTSGTVAGEPPSDIDKLYAHKGMAYRSKLAVFDYQGVNAAPDDMVLPEDIYDDYLTRAYEMFGVRVTSNSWGDQSGMYDTFSKAVDKFTWDHPDFLNFFAVGNTGTVGRLTIASPALSKNVVAVGSTMNSPFSFADRDTDSGFRLLRVPEIAGAEPVNAGHGITVALRPGEVIGVTPGQFGLPYRNLTRVITAGRPLQLINMVPFDGCSRAQNQEELAGAAVIVMRGTCQFSVKAANAQAAGAVLLIVINDKDSPPDIMYSDAGDNEIAQVDPSTARIGSVMIEKAIGERLSQYAGTKRIPFDASGTTSGTSGVFIEAPIPFVLPTHNEFRLSSFSSRGPTKDGRIKPDIVAPGEYILSSRSDGRLNTFQCNADDGSTLKAMQGTSMAAPVAAGSALLIREYFMKGYYPSGRETAPLGVFELTEPRFRTEIAANRTLAQLGSGRPDRHGTLRASSPDAFNPSAALVKAVLAHCTVAVGGPVRSAEDESRYEAVLPPPSIHQGHGRIKLDNVLTFADEPQPRPSVFLVDYTAEPHRQMNAEHPELPTGGPSASSMIRNGESRVFCFDATELIRSAYDYHSEHSNPHGYLSIYGGGATTETTGYPYAYSATSPPFARATLAWSDYPASLVSSQYLVNDLDLTALLVRKQGPNSPDGKPAYGLFVGNENANLLTDTGDDISNHYTAHSFSKFYPDLSDIEHPSGGQYTPVWRATNPMQSKESSSRNMRTQAVTSTESVLDRGTGKQWDHVNNLESVIVSSRDIVEATSTVETFSNVRDSDIVASLNGNARKLVGDASDWVLQVSVHGTSVPRGPQPFALVISTLHGGEIKTKRLPASVCAAASADILVSDRGRALRLSQSDWRSSMQAFARHQPESVSNVESAGPQALGADRVAHPMQAAPVGELVNGISLPRGPTVNEVASPAPLESSITRPVLCPNNCSGHGRCVAVPPLAASAGNLAGGVASDVLTPTWGCVCEGAWAGADCSIAATEVPAASQVNSFQLTADGRVRPGESKFYYVYVPPAGKKGRVGIDPKTGSTSPFHPHGGEEDEDAGLILTFYRRSDQGDVDYFVLAPSEPVNLETLVKQHQGRNEGLARDGSASTIALSELTAREIAELGSVAAAANNVQATLAENSPTSRSSQASRSPVSPLATPEHYLSQGGWPSKSYFSYASTMCDNCFDDVMATLQEEYIDSQGIQGQIKVTQRLYIPLSQIPVTGGYYKIVAVGQCCTDVDFSLTAYMRGVTLNVLDPSDFPSGSIIPSLNSPDPTVIDAYRHASRLIAQQASAASGASAPSEARGVQTSIRLASDFRILPSSVFQQFEEELSVLLGLEDAPCRVKVTLIERIPRSRPYPKAPLLQNVFRPFHSEEDAALAGAEPAATRHVETMQGSFNRGYIEFAILPPPHVKSFRAFMASNRDARQAPQTCFKRPAREESLESAETLYAMIRHAYELMTPSNSYAIHPIGTAGVDNGHMIQLLSAKEAQETHSTVTLSDDLRARVRRGVEKLQLLAKARAGTDSSVNTDERGVRTMELPSILPFTSTILAQIDLDHKPPFEYVVTHLCRDGTYQLACNELRISTSGTTTGQPNDTQPNLTEGGLGSTNETRNNTVVIPPPNVNAPNAGPDYHPSASSRVGLIIGIFALIVFAIGFWYWRRKVNSRAAQLAADSGNSGGLFGNSRHNALEEASSLPDPIFDRVSGDQNSGLAPYGQVGRNHQSQSNHSVRAAGPRAQGGHLDEIDLALSDGMGIPEPTIQESALLNELGLSGGVRYLSQVGDSTSAYDMVPPLLPPPGPPSPAARASALHTRGADSSDRPQLGDVAFEIEDNYAPTVGIADGGTLSAAVQPQAGTNAAEESEQWHRREMEEEKLALAAAESLLGAAAGQLTGGQPSSGHKSGQGKRNKGGKSKNTTKPQLDEIL